MRKEGPVAGGGRGRGRRRHEAGGGTSGRGGKVGRRIGADDRSFVRSTAGESGESEQEGCSHDRGGCFERAWEEHGGGDDEDDEGGKGEEKATPRAKPRHAGGENNKDEKKKRKNTETPPPPRQVKKSKTAAGINGQKPKTPPGRQASVVSDRPHQNKTTVLTWLGPGTTEAGGERRAREVWLRRRKRKASTLVHSMHPTLGKLECLSLSDIRTCAATCVWLCIPAACPACSYVGTRGYLSPKRPPHPLSPTSLLASSSRKMGPPPSAYHRRPGRFHPPLGPPPHGTRRDRTAPPTPPHHHHHIPAKGQPSAAASGTNPQYPHPTPHQGLRLLSLTSPSVVK